MLERSIRHAWKLTPAARADTHEIPPTHFRSTTSHNNDVHARVLVNAGVDSRFRGVCDTVLTQFSFPLPTAHTCAHQLTPKAKSRTRSTRTCPLLCAIAGRGRVSSDLEMKCRAAPDLADGPDAPTVSLDNSFAKSRGRDPRRHVTYDRLARIDRRHAVDRLRGCHGPSR